MRNFLTLKGLRATRERVAPNMRVMHSRCRNTRGEPSGRHVGVRQILRAAAITGALGAESTLQSDSLFAQTRATITATAVVTGPTASFHSLERATLLVNQAAQEPSSLTGQVRLQAETGPSTITVLTMKPPESSMHIDRTPNQDAVVTTAATTRPMRSQTDEHPATLLVTIAYTGN